MRSLKLLSAALLVALPLVSGCHAQKEAKTTFTSVGSTVGSPAPSDGTRVGSADGGARSVRPALTEEAKGEPVAGAAPKHAPAAQAPATPPPAARPDAAVADAVVAMARPAPKPVQQTGPKSGILTAGSFDDNVNPAVFQSFAGKMAQRRELGDLPVRLQGERLVILVKDSAGKPVGDARVTLRADGAASPELPTRSDGRAVFVLSWDQLPAGKPLIANITPPAGGAPIVETVMPGSARWEVTLPGTQARLPKNLDFAIVLDTTGSMGDELEYLKSEIRGISAAIQQRFPEVRQRFALVLYRDQGDPYVTRPFDFTESLDAFHRNLSAQSAGGGGDEPEAMHSGLESVLQLRWRDADAARVLFLVADAPPHAQHMTKTMQAADALRKRGVALYPVACSGYNDVCELVMRSCALLSGSQFLFLTDDSGVGNAHAEPRIPYYQVERLDRLMVRVIGSELSGRRLEPAPADIIRTVGRKVN